MDRVGETALPCVVMTAAWSGVGSAMKSPPVAGAEGKAQGLGLGCGPSFYQIRSVGSPGPPGGTV